MPCYNKDNKIQYDTLLSLTGEAELQVRFRVEDVVGWKIVTNKLDYLPVVYLETVIEYEVAYKQGEGSPISDVSMVLYNDNQPCAIWPLSLGIDMVTLGSNGGPLLPPLFISEVSRKLEKKINKKCLDFINLLLNHIQVKRVLSYEPFQNKHGCSDWYQQAMMRGGELSVKHELFVDLSLTLETIRSSIRKSYKPLISSGSRHWDVSIMDGRNDLVWDEFKNLHKTTVGRSTRCDKTWNIQHEDICNNKSFLVYLKDKNKRIVGGGLFIFTNTEGSYATGVYNRDLFDKPLGHVVQYKAIEELKRREIHWYRMGLRPYPTEFPTPSTKEMTISNFKDGFATNVFCRNYITIGNSLI